jgi:hypothetical protein
LGRVDGGPGDVSMHSFNPSAAQISTLYAANVTRRSWSSRARRRFPRVWSSLLKVKMDVLGIPETHQLGIEDIRLGQKRTGIQFCLYLLLTSFQKELLETIVQILVSMCRTRSCSSWSLSVRRASHIFFGHRRGINEFLHCKHRMKTGLD